MKLKNLIKLALSFSVVASLALVAFFAFGFVSKVSSASAQTAPTAGTYGEFRAVKTDKNGSSYVVVFGGNFSGANNAISGASFSGVLNVYVVVQSQESFVENGTTYACVPTFKANGEWNYMASSITIGSTEHQPNARVQFPSSLSYNKTEMCGAYNVSKYEVYNGTTSSGEFEERYLVHSFELTQNSAISIDFNYAQKQTAKVFVNSLAYATIANYGFAEVENTSSFLNAEAIRNAVSQKYQVAEGTTNCGWYDITNPQEPVLLSNNDVFNSPIPHSNASDPNANASALVSFGLNLQTTKKLNLASITLSQNVGENGGTAHLVQSTNVCGNKKTQEFFFASNLSDGEISANFASSRLAEVVLQGQTQSFVATPNDGYVLVGWFKNGEFVSSSTTLSATNQSSTNPLSSANLVANDQIVAVFAQMTNTQVFTTTNGELWSDGGVAFVTHTTCGVKTGALFGSTTSISVTPNKGYNFVGFFVGGQQITPSNATSILGEGAVANGQTLSYNIRGDQIIEVRFATQLQLSIATNLMFGSTGQAHADPSIFGTSNPFVSVYANGNLLVPNISNGVATFNLEYGDDVTVQISSNSSYYSFRSLLSQTAEEELASIQHTLLLGSEAFASNEDKTLEHHFVATQALSMILNLNAKSVELQSEANGAQISTTAYLIYQNNALSGVGFLRFWVSASPSRTLQSGSISINANGTMYVLKSFVSPVVSISAGDVEAFNAAHGCSVTLADVLKVLQNESGAQDADLQQALALSTASGAISLSFNEVASVVVSASSPEISGSIETEVVSILQNGNKVASNVTSPAVLVSGTEYSVFAKKSFTASGKTYAFSHFELDGAVLVSITNIQNGNAKLSVSSSGYGVTLSASRNASVHAVYRGVVEVSLLCIKDDNNQSSLQLTTTTNAANGYLPTSGNFYPLGIDVTFTCNESYFSHYEVSDGTNVTSHVGRNLGISVSQNLSITVVIRTPMNAVVQNYSGSLSGSGSSFNGVYAATLLYNNGTYSFVRAPENSVSSSVSSVRHSNLFTITALPQNGYEFLGYYVIPSNQTSLSYAALTRIDGNFSITCAANKNQRVVALYAPQTTITALSNTGVLVSVSGNNGNTADNQIFGYAGQEVTLSVADATNFIGYYNASNLSSPLSLLPTYQFVANGKTEIVALFGNQTLSAQISTFGGSAQASIVANTNDGRNAISSTSSVSSVFANGVGNITLSASVPSGYAFVGWFDEHNALVSKEQTLTLPKNMGSISVRAEVRQVLSFVVETSGTNTTQRLVSGVPQGQVLYGDSVTLVAHSSGINHFKEFVVSKNGTSQTFSQNSTTILVTSNTSVVAVFEPQIQISVSQNVADSAITSISDGSNSHADLLYVDEGSNVSVSVTPNSAYSLTYFLVNGQKVELSSANVTKSGNTYVLSLSNVHEAQNVVAVLTQQVQLSVSTSVVAGSSSNSNYVLVKEYAINNIILNSLAASSISLTKNDYVTIEAVVGDGYEFAGFVIKGTFVPMESQSQNKLTFRISTSTEVVALFKQVHSVTIAYTTREANDYVSANGQKITSGTTLQFVHGSTLSLSFHPQSADSVVVSGGQNVTYSGLTFDVTSSQTISASFEKQSFVQLTSVVTGCTLNGAQSSPNMPVFYAAKTGETLTLSAPLQKNGLLFVGFFANGVAQENQNATCASGVVSLVVSAPAGNTIIEARYSECITTYLSAKSGNLPIKASDKLFGISVGGTSAPWLLSTLTQQGASATFSMLLPTTLATTLTADSSNFSGWFFVANNNLSNVYYNFNKIGEDASLTFIAGALSRVTKNPYLLMGYNATINAPTTTSFEIDPQISENGNTLTSSYGFEVKIGLSASNLWLRISTANEVTLVREENGVVQINEGATTIYHGYACGVRPIGAANSNFASLLSAVNAFNNDSSSSFTLVASASPLQDAVYLSVVPKVGRYFNTTSTLTLFGGNKSGCTFSFGSSFIFDATEFSSFVSNVEAQINTLNRITILSPCATTSVGGLQNTTQFVVSGQKLIVSPNEMSQNGNTLSFQNWLINGVSSAVREQSVSVQQNTEFVAVYGQKAIITYTTNSTGAQSTSTQIFVGGTYTATAAPQTNAEFVGFRITANGGYEQFVPASQTAQNGNTYVLQIVVQKSLTITAEYRANSVAQVFVQSFDANGNIVSTSNSVYKDGVAFASSATSGSVMLGTEPTILQARAQNGYVFAGWYSSNGQVLGTKISSSASLNLSNVVELSEDKIVAVFRIATSLEVSSNVAGAMPIASETIALYQQITLRAPSVTGYSFSHFVLNGTNIYQNTLSFTITQATEVQLVYKKLVDVVLSQTTGGLAQIQGSGSNSLQTAEGTAITFVAQNNAGYVFAGWVANGVPMGQNPTLTLSANDNLSVQAIFKQKVTLSLVGNVSWFGVLSNGWVSTSTGVVGAFASGQNLIAAEGSTFNLFAYAQSGSTILSATDEGVTTPVNAQTWQNTCSSAQNVVTETQLSNIQSYVVSVSCTTTGVSVTGSGAYKNGSSVLLSPVVASDTIILTSLSQIDATTSAYKYVLVLDGWYENNIKISSEPTLTLENITQNRNLTLKFDRYVRVRVDQNEYGNASVQVEVTPVVSGTLRQSLANVYFAKQDTEVVVSALSANASVLQISSNGQVLALPSSLLSSSLQATFAPKEACDTMVAVAELHNLTLVAENGQGSFGVVQATLPTGQVLAAAINTEQQQIHLQIPHGTSVRINANGQSGVQLLGYNHNGTFTEGASELLVDVTEDQTITAIFAKLYLFQVVAQSADGTNLSVLPSSSTLVAGSQVATTSFDATSLQDVLVQTASGAVVSVGKDFARLQNLFGSEAEAQQNGSQITLSGLEISQDCTMIVVYSKEVALSLTFKITSGATASASSTIYDAQGNEVSTLLFGQNYKLVVSSVATLGSISYAIVGIMQNGSYTTNTNELWFTAEDQNNFVAVFGTMYEISVKVVDSNFVEDGSLGQVYGNGTYFEDTVTLAAMANTGYVFVGWYDQGHNPLSTEKTAELQSASSVAFAVFAKSIKITLSAGMGGSVSLFDEEGTCLGSAESGQYQIVEVQGDQTLVITLAPNVGYRTLSVTKNGTSLGTAPSISLGLVTSNTYISASFKKQVEVSASMVTNGAAPLAAGSFDISHSGNVDENQEVTISNIHVPTGSATYGLVGVYANGQKLEEIGGTYTFEAKENTTILVKFAQILTITLAVDGNDLVGTPFDKNTLFSQMTYNGTTGFSSSNNTTTAFYGEVFEVVASTAGSFDFVQHSVGVTGSTDGTIYNINPLHIVPQQNITITTTFKTQVRTISIYFPSDVRNFAGTIGVENLKMTIKNGSNTWLVVAGDDVTETEAANKPQNATYALVGEYLVITMQKGATDNLKVEFNKTPRGSVSYMDTLYACADSSSAYEVIPTGSSLVTNLTIDFEYDTFVKLEFTHNAPFANNGSETVQYRISVVMSNGDRYSTQTANTRGQLLIEVWVKLGTTATFNMKADEQASTQNIAVLKGAMITTLPVATSTDPIILDSAPVGSLAEDFPINFFCIQDYWTAAGVNNDQANVSAGPQQDVLLLSDTSVVADYIGVWTQNTNPIVLTVANNSQAQGTASLVANQAAANASHGLQNFAYSINSNVYAPHSTTTLQNQVTNNGQVFVQAGMLVNDTIHITQINTDEVTYSIVGSGTNQTATAGSQITDTNGKTFIIHQIIPLQGAYAIVGSTKEDDTDTNTNIQIFGAIAHSSQINGAQNVSGLVSLTSQTANKKGSGTSAIEIEDATITSTETLNASGQTEVVVSAPATIDSVVQNNQGNEVSMTAHFAGFIVLHFAGTQVCEDVQIAVSGYTIYQGQAANDVFNLTSQNFISKSSCSSQNGTFTFTLPVKGNIKVVALYEREIYQVTPNKLAMFKTDANGNVNIDGIKIQISSTSKENIANESIRNDVLDIKQNTHDNTYEIYTTRPSNIGTLKGSMLFESGEEANVTASVFQFGEFAGFAIATSNGGSLASDQYTLSADKLNANGDRETESSHLASATIYKALRDGVTSLPNQIISFVVNQNLNLNLFFSSMRYEVTITFAEYIDESSDQNNDAISMLFGANGGVLDNVKHLSNPNNYSNITQVLKIVDDTQQEISYRQTQENGGLQVKFTIDAKAGAGFGGFNIIFNKTNENNQRLFNVYGDTMLFAPKEQITHPNNIGDQPQMQMIKTISDATPVAFSYNNQIGSLTEVKANEYAQFVKSPELVIATRKRLSTLTNNEQDGRQIAVLKGTNAYAEKLNQNNQLSSFNQAMTEYVTSGASLIQTIFCIINHDNRIKSAEEQLEGLQQNPAFMQNFIPYLYAMQVPGVLFDKDISSLTDDQKNELGIVGIVHKVRLENGHYLTIDIDDKKVSAYEYKTDEEKYHNKSVTIDEHNKVTITIDSTTKETYDLITQIEVNLATLATMENTITAGDKAVNYLNGKTQVVEIYNNDQGTIKLDQDDVVIDKEVAKSQQKAESYDPSDYLEDNSKNAASKYWYYFGRPNKVSRAYDYINNIEVKFMGPRTPNNEDQYITTSSTGYLFREGHNEATWNVFDTLYNNLFYNYALENLSAFDTWNLSEEEEEACATHRNGNIKYEVNGSDSRFSFNAFAYFANDYETCQTGKISIARTELTSEVYVLHAYNPLHSSWQETWPSLVSGIAIGIITIVGTYLAATGVGAPLALGLFAVGMALATITDMGVQKAITRTITSRMVESDRWAFAEFRAVQNALYYMTQDHSQEH